MYNKCNFHRLNTWVINYVNRYWHLLLSFVTGIGECAVGDLLVNRSGVDTTVGDRLSDRGAKAGVFGLWVWAWLVVGNASTPGD